MWDWIAFDPQLELMPADTSPRAIWDERPLWLRFWLPARPVDSGQPAGGCHPLFTITPRKWAPGSSSVHGDIAEMVSLDIAIAAPGQNTDEHAVTICLQDMSGPFDYHLTRLIGLARQYGRPPA